MPSPSEFELRLFHHLNHLGIPSLDPIMLFISESSVWWTLGIIATMGFLATRKKRLITAWLGCLLALVIADFTNTHLLKERIQRPRPCHELTTVNLVQSYCGGRNGFPSNHAANGMAITLSIGLFFGWRYGVPAILMALVVGFSRIYLGVHYPSDVIAGSLWGGLVAYSLWRLRKLPTPH